MIKNFDYDKHTDSLIISRKQEGEQVQGSAEVGNLILDFTSDGKIINVEFQGISQFLESMKINPNILNELESVNLNVQKQKGAISLFVILKTPKIEQPLPLSSIPIAN